jgi:PPOX class probable FMN-dependent enzyme
VTAGWRADLAGALAAAADNPTARYLQLATVTAGDEPANRTVVFRGFDAEGGLLIATDRRSGKVADIVHQPSVELCWWLAVTRQQFRLTGRADLVADKAVIGRIWQDLARPVRQPFFGPAPGSPLGPAQPAVADRTVAEPPGSFAVLCVTVERVDQLDLRPTPHSRLVHGRTGDG